MCTNTGGVTDFQSHATNSHVSGAVHFLAHKMVGCAPTLPKRISDSEIRITEHDIDQDAMVDMFGDNDKPSI